MNGLKIFTCWFDAFLCFHCITMNREIDLPITPSLVIEPYVISLINMQKSCASRRDLRRRHQPSMLSAGPRSNWGSNIKENDEASNDASSDISYEEDFSDDEYVPETDQDESEDSGTSEIVGGNFPVIIFTFYIHNLARIQLAVCREYRSITSINFNTNFSTLSFQM